MQFTSPSPADFRSQQRTAPFVDVPERVGGRRSAFHHLKHDAIPLAMFLGTFSWSFVSVRLPFYIGTISHGDVASTLRWTGWILGTAPLVAVLTAPLWDRYAEHGRPSFLESSRRSASPRPGRSRSAAS